MSTPTVLWQVAASHVAVLRRASTSPDAQVLLTLFPPRPAPGQPRGGSTYYPATARDVLDSDWALLETVESDLHHRPGHSLGLVVNEADPHPEDWRPGPETGRAWGTRNAHISSCWWLFSECDHDGFGLAEQVALATGVYGANPSLVITTGNKSAHTYYRLTEPITAARFTALQKLVIAAYLHLEPGCSVDRSLAKPAQVMQLAGGLHPRTGRHALIHSASTIVVDPEQLEARLQALLPAPAPPPSPPIDRRPWPHGPHRPTRGHLQPPTLLEITDALSRSPKRVPEQGDYPNHRNLLWGLVKACKEAGGTVETAISLMEAHSPSSACGWDVRQIATSGGRDAHPGWFWAQVGGHPARRQGVLR